MPKSARWWALGVAVLVGMGAAAFLGARASAAGVPSDSLRYSGVLELPDGTPVTGTHAVYVVFWRAASEGDSLCETGSSDVEVTRGHFSLALPATCADAIHATPDVFVEVRVDAVSLGRARIGAVPFALEAAAASRASGDLEARLAALEARSTTTSAFQAQQTETQFIDSGVDTLVRFNGEAFDLGGEYDPATSTFVPTQAGLYLLRCSIRFENGQPGLVAWLSTAIRRNGAVVARDAFYGDVWSAYRSAQRIVELAPGDQIDCIADQEGGQASQPIASDAATVFEAFKLAGR